jgi:hypothetical protein
MFGAYAFPARGGAKGRLAVRQISNPVKEGNKMKPSTENVIAGKVHEVKGARLRKRWAN